MSILREILLGVADLYTPDTRTGVAQHPIERIAVTSEYPLSYLQALRSPMPDLGWPGVESLREVLRFDPGSDHIGVPQDFDNYVKHNQISSAVPFHSHKGPTLSEAWCWFISTGLEERIRYYPRVKVGGNIFDGRIRKYPSASLKRSVSLKRGRMLSRLAGGLKSLMIHSSLVRLSRIMRHPSLLRLIRS